MGKNLDPVFHVSTNSLLEILEHRAKVYPAAFTPELRLRLLVLTDLLTDAYLFHFWWGKLTAEERAEWLQRADSVVPEDAWRLFRHQNET